MALLQNVVQRGLGMQPNTSGHSKSLRARARYVLHHDDGDGGDDDDGGWVVKMMMMGGGGRRLLSDLGECSAGAITANPECSASLSSV